MDKEVKDKVLAMNKKILSLIVVLFMIFQTVSYTAFAGTSALEDNTEIALNETALAIVITPFYIVHLWYIQIFLQA